MVRHGIQQGIALTPFLGFVILTVGLVVPGACLFTLLRPVGVPLATAVPTAVGLSLAAVSIAAWLGYLTHTGFGAVAVMTGAAVIAMVAARVVLRARSAPFVRPAAGDVAPGVLAAIAVVLGLIDGPWLSQTADQFYHLAATRSLLEARSALPMQVFFSVPVKYPDESSGSLHVVAAWLSLVIGLIPAWAALAAFGAGFVALAFAAFARELTGSAAVGGVAAALYLLLWLNLDFRTSGYPNHLAPGLVWLAMVFVLRYVRAPGRAGQPDLIIAALLAIAAGSIHSGMPPFVLVLLGVTAGAATVVQLWRRDLKPLRPLLAACAVVAGVTLPVLALRLLALPAPGSDGWLMTEAPPLTTHVIAHFYPFVDFRFWFDGLVTISTVGTACLVGRSRIAWVKGDAAGALLIGGILVIPALCVTPILPRFVDSLYYFARISDLLRPLCLIAIAWELTWAASALAPRLRARALPARVRRLELAAAAVVAAVALMLFEYVPSGAVDRYFGPGDLTVAASHRNDLTQQWSDRLQALDAAGSGTLLANLASSYEIAGLTGRPIVAVAFSHIPYQDYARDGMLRLGDVLDAMRPSAGPTLLMSILVRYHVSYVLVDRTADGQAAWDYMASQPALVPVADGGSWRLYRFEGTRLDDELQVPLSGAAGVAPAKTFAGRAIFARFDAPAAGAHGAVIATGETTGAAFRAPFVAPAEQTGGLRPRLTEPLVFPESAPIDAYRVSVDTGTGTVEAGSVQVGRDYEAESFAGIVDFYWNGGFVRNPGWLTKYGPFSRGVAVAGLQPNRVASKPLLDPPGDYCLDAGVFGEGSGRPYRVDVGVGGATVALSWTDDTGGLRDLSASVHVGSSNRELSFWVPSGGTTPLTVDYVALWPAGSC